MKLYESVKTNEKNPMVQMVPMGDTFTEDDTISNSSSNSSNSNVINVDVVTKPKTKQFRNNSNPFVKIAVAIAFLGLSLAYLSCYLDHHHNEQQSFEHGQEDEHEHHDHDHYDHEHHDHDHDHYDHEHHDHGMDKHDPNEAASTQNGEEARWLVQSTKWTTLSWIEGENVQSMVTSHAESDGSIFFYLMQEPDEWTSFKASMTLSEAQVDPTQFYGARCGPEGKTDPEDPRCAKLTITGEVSPITDKASKQIALDALFEAHPQMKNWPPEHGFAPFQFIIQKDHGLWMIANYGGGSYIDTAEYYNSKPVHHPAKGYGNDDGNDDGGSAPTVLPRPDFGDDTAGHARWIVAKSLWMTISTISPQDNSDDEHTPFGNIRSIADGACFLGSSGLPYFYIPGPDPTAAGIKINHMISLSFTEAALAERVGDDGIACGGMDAEDPTCAKLTLVGHAVPLNDDGLIENAKKSFGAQHPRASWLSGGGAHTGGAYYSIHLHKILFLRTYGGFTELTPEEYLGWTPGSDIKSSGEEECEMYAYNYQDVTTTFP